MLRTIIFMTALLAAPASASSGSHICVLPSLWTPTHTPESWGGTSTCQAKLDQYASLTDTALGGLSGINFSQKVQCSSLNTKQKDIIDKITMHCCGNVGNKANPCRDRGWVCSDPRFFQPGATTGVSDMSPSDQATNCDQLVAELSESMDYTRPISCKDEPDFVKEEVNNIAEKCCQRKSAGACSDYSHICKSPELFTPLAPAKNYLMWPCRSAIAHTTNFKAGESLLDGKDFTTAFSCGSETIEVKKLVNAFASNCCGSDGLEASPCYGLLPACSKTDGIEANDNDCQCGKTQCDEKSGRHCELTTNTCDNGVMGRIVGTLNRLNPVCLGEGRRLTSDSADNEGRRLTSDSKCRNLLSHATTTSFSTLTQIAVLIVCLGFF